jgi:hypothetical protein
MDKILLKKARGEELTKQEKKILAYGYYAARRLSLAVWIRPREES